MKTIWQQWDEQTNDKWEAYVELNNLYLGIQRGSIPLNIHTSNRLRCLATKAYRRSDTTLLDYWQREFEKLPNWNNV